MTAFLGATQTAYDIFAGDYAEQFSGELRDQPFERALLSTFAELSKNSGLGPVADIGCGPGHVTALLSAMGLNAFGVDLSPAMVAVARQANPGMRFDVGSMTALDQPDGTLGGILAMYSIIHIPQEALPGVLAEFYRVLAPGAPALVAFLLGDEMLHRSEAFGHEISLDYYLRQPEPVADLLTQAGFIVTAQARREPTETEQLPRAFVLAHKPSVDSTLGGPPSNEKAPVANGHPNQESEE